MPNLNYTLYFYEKHVWFLGVFSDDGPTWLYTKRFALRELRDLGFGRRSETYESILEEETNDFIEAIKKDCTDGNSTLIPEIFFPPLLNCIFYILTGNRVSPSEHKKLRVPWHDFGRGKLLWDAVQSILMPKFCIYLRGQLFKFIWPLRLRRLLPLVKTKYSRGKDEWT